MCVELHLYFSLLKCISVLGNVNHQGNCNLRTDSSPRTRGWKKILVIFISYRFCCFLPVTLYLVHNLVSLFLWILSNHNSFSKKKKKQCSHDLGWNLSNLTFYIHNKSHLKHVLTNSGTKLTSSWPCPRHREQNLLPPNPKRSANFARSPTVSDAGLEMNTTGIVGLVCSNMASKLENKISKTAWY